MAVKFSSIGKGLGKVMAGRTLARERLGLPAQGFYAPATVMPSMRRVGASVP